MELQILKTCIKTEVGKKGENYASILIVKDSNKTEIGFINDNGIWLRIYNPNISIGVFYKLDIPQMKFIDYCKFVENHFTAIYDKYDLLIKKEILKIKTGAVKPNPEKSCVNQNPPPKSN